MKMAEKKIISLILAIATLLSLTSVMAVSSLATSYGITAYGGWLESAYAEWAEVPGADGYNAYVASAGSDEWTPVDDMLIRKYPSCWRVDAVGLKAGSYRIKIVPTKDGSEMSNTLITPDLDVLAHDRSGFAFVNGTSSGAYNEDGTLKSNARVIYVTDKNKDTVTMDVAISKAGPEPIVGIQNILTALKKGYESAPVCVRFIGNITDPATLDKGDLLIDFGEGKFAGGMTVEGIGEDTVFNGFGIRIKGVSNLEVRNIGFMNCDSNEGDSISLQQDNDHVWVHNCDIFYGMAGSDADQDKGDGALDTKKSTYVTHSYNHFYDTGKSNLLGNSGESESNYLSYHHNWYDHSDSRHPRVRTCSVHVYNNLFDGISKYGIGATEGASIFAENNYFLNTNYAMLISMQGSDIADDGEGTFSSENGGIIKAFGNVYAGTGHPVVTYQQSSTQFDCYLASSRDEKVPASVVATKGGSDYNNFDTSSVMYDYEVESAEAAMKTVKKYAGRMMGGDFKWEFTDADNTSYAVNTELKSALVSYKGSIVSYGGSGTNNSGNQGGSGDNTGSGDNGGNQGGDSGDNGSGDNGGNNSGTTLPAGSYAHNFTENGKTDPNGFFKINGNLSSSKGSVTYNGLSLTQCLKIESSTSISFTAPAKGTLVLVFGGSTNASGKQIKVDGELVDIGSDQIASITVEAGAHTITKDDSIFLFYMAYCSEQQEHTHSFAEGKCECGEVDPDYTPDVPHEHYFVEGKCECGEVDPDYTPANPDDENPKDPENPDGDSPDNSEDPENPDDDYISDEDDEPGMNCSPPRRPFWDAIASLFKAIGNFFARLFGINKK